jgi:hypothetical protein
MAVRDDVDQLHNYIFNLTRDHAQEITPVSWFDLAFSGLSIYVLLELLLISFFFLNPPYCSCSFTILALSWKHSCVYSDICDTKLQVQCHVSSNYMLYAQLWPNFNLLWPRAVTDDCNRSSPT